MTVSVMSVLFTPRKAPARMTPTTRTVLFSVQIAMAARMTAKPSSAPTMPARVPKRRWIIGATKTDVMASRTPQPKKMNPIWCAPMASGNGVKASSVKKPKL